VIAFCRYDIGVAGGVADMSFFLEQFFPNVSLDIQNPHQSQAATRNYGSDRCRGTSPHPEPSVYPLQVHLSTALAEHAISNSIPVLMQIHQEKPEDPFCTYNDPTLSFFISVLFLAGIVGALLGSITNTHWGRKPTMIVGGMFFCAGAILMAAAVNVTMLVLGRVLLGLGVGASVQCGPLFLSELAPCHLRGAFNVQFR
jgi:hypothetical protein